MNRKSSRNGADRAVTLFALQPSMLVAASGTGPFSASDFAGRSVRCGLNLYLLRQGRLLVLSCGRGFK